MPEAAPRYHASQEVILLFLRKSWRAYIIEYRGWHTNSKGQSAHYYKVLFRNTASSKEHRLDVPEHYLLPIEQEASHA